MTKSDFLFVCNEKSINPSVALENKEVIKLLKNNKGKNDIKTQLELSTLLDIEF